MISLGEFPMICGGVRAVKHTVTHRQVIGVVGEGAVIIARIVAAHVATAGIAAMGVPSRAVMASATWASAKVEQ